ELPTRDYTVNFDGCRIRTTVTYDRHTVAEWIHSIDKFYAKHLDSLIIGVDISSYHPGDSDTGKKVAILKLCVGHQCLIYQLLYAYYVPGCLDDFFINKNYTFVGLNIASNLENLQEDHGFDSILVNKVELLDLTGVHYVCGLNLLSLDFLGKKISRPRRVGAWDCELLALRQIRYASVRAFATFEIGRILNA
ncbi:hypothetical protein M569_12228, partial [Genlisea aurea]